MDQDEGQQVQGEAAVQTQVAEGDEPYFPDVKLGEAWGESITKRRAEKLEGMLQEWEAERNRGERIGPFDKVQLTGADVFWLAARTRGSSEPERVAEQAQLLRLAQSATVFPLYVELSKLRL